MRAVPHNRSRVSDLLLVRYGELALKSPPVRREFEGALRRNLLDLFLAAGTTCRVRSDRGHLYLEVDDPANALRLARRVFGVTSVSLAREVPTDREEIRRALVDLARPEVAPGRSFAIRARRTGQHPFTSQELAAELGGVVLDAWPELGLRVDLGRPDLELSVEVRGPRTYLYRDRRAGPGGLPLGVAGRVVALVDGPRGGLGAYLMMKRGCRCELVVAGPDGTGASVTLGRFDPKLAARPAPPGSTGADGAIAEAAERSRADAIVLGIGVDALTEARSRWGDRPVFSPTVGLSDAEVTERWQAVEELAA